MFHFQSDYPLRKCNIVTFCSYLSLQNRNKKITEASELLKSGTMSPIDFINKVRHNDDDLCHNLNMIEENNAVTADDETELENEIESECQALLLADQAEQNAEIDFNEQSNSENNPVADDGSDSDEPTDGACIACRKNLACVVFLTCTHNAVCLSCYENVKQTHIDNCNRWYADNPRKLARELKHLKCPACNMVAKNVIPIRSNSFK